MNARAFLRLSFVFRSSFFQSYSNERRTRDLRETNEIHRLGSHYTGSLSRLFIDDTTISLTDAIKYIVEKVVQKPG
ncbi:MAG: hypothetical protein H7Y03_14030 [Chitinophagaceae bacterium]|nr:hypothetical protein [Chitinophagaceae bacterium]